MLYFSKTRILFISIFSIILIYLCLSNFFKFDDNFINKKINLGLDLQGGSYLLLEIDNTPVILKTLQNSLSSIKKFLKDKKINFKDLRIENEKNMLINHWIDNVQESFSLTQQNSVSLKIIYYLDYLYLRK